MNNVIKVISKNGAYIFIIQTDGEEGFWCWEVSEGVWLNYWGSPVDRTPKTCEQFANDLDNGDKGTSWGSYDTIEEILKEEGIINV